MKVEVHHIVPQSEGGPDTIDNAIALCFDCHTDAGHYNPLHPRGSRFSRKELTNARDRWHEIVSSRSLSLPPADSLHCRYFLCKFFELIREIASGNLKQIPVKKPLLARNDVFETVQTLVLEHPHDYRHDTIHGSSYDDRSTYLKAHPKARPVDRSQNAVFPTFGVFRHISSPEFREHVAAQDSTSAFLAQCGMPIDEICIGLASDQPCGTYSFHEEYRVRPLWLILLAATNLENHPLRIRQVNVLADRDGDCVRMVVARGSSEVVVLPAPSIPAGQTLIFPVAIAAGPLSGAFEDETWKEFREISRGQAQVLTHGGLRSHEDTVRLGPALWPVEIVLEETCQELHQFDPENLFIVDRHWEMGSCPHIFLQSDEGVEYAGSIFNLGPYKKQEAQLLFPRG